MSTRTQQSYIRPLVAAIADGATSPDPGLTHALVISSITGGWLRWTGSAWTALAASDTTRVAKAGDTITGAITMSRNAAGYTLIINNPHATGQAINAIIGSAFYSVIEGRVTGDTYARFGVTGDGTFYIGSGAVAMDTNLYRSAANTLKTDDNLIVALGFQVIGAATLNTLAVGAVTGSSSFASIRAAAGDSAFLCNVTADTQYRHQVTADGKHLWSGGSGVLDTNLYRSAADTLKTDDSLIVGTALTVSGVLDLAAGAAGVGGLRIGVDVNLYRSATNVLATDDRIDAGGGLKVIGNVGFYGATIQAKQTVAGQRNDGTALASLLTALSTLGLVTDSSTAGITTQTGTTYTVTATDAVVLLNNAAMVATLPSAVTAGAGRTYTVKNINAAVATVKATAGTLDGVAAATGVPLAQYEAVSFISDGTNWHRI